MSGIAKVSSQAQEVAGKAQYECLHLLPGIAVNFFREFLDGLKRQFLRGHMPHDLLDLLELLFRNESLAELLQVDGRTIIRGDGPDFIPIHTMIENFILLDTVEEPREQARAR